LLKTIILILLTLAAPAFAEEDPGIKLTPEVIERGRALYTQYCVACHGLKYYRGEEAKTGIPPAMDPATAEAAFGVAPPDLSLMAAARGRGQEGAAYIYRLLTTYYTVDGQIRNKAFAEETKTDGAIAMPPPISMDDPALKEKARDISAFLQKVSDPSAEERRGLGPRVMAYMFLLTTVLYLLNRYTWKEVKKKLNS
jgi:ubiquinol-cytochrome c reductase cytochrome c1 subunit